MNIIKSLAYNAKNPYIYAPLLRFDGKVLTISSFKCEESDVAKFDLSIIATTTTTTTTESGAIPTESEVMHEVTHKVRKISAEEKKVIDENHLDDIKHLIEELKRIVAVFSVIKNDEIEFGALNDENDFVNLTCTDTSEFKSLHLCRCCLLMEVKAMVRLLEEKFNLV